MRRCARGRGGRAQSKKDRLKDRAKERELMLGMSTQLDDLMSDLPMQYVAEQRARRDAAWAPQYDDSPGASDED